MLEQWISALQLLHKDLWGSADGTSINTNRLICMWKVEMKRRNSIKEEGGNETRGSRKKEKIIVTSRTDFVIKLERNT